MVDIDLQKVKIETHWPVIARIEDDLFPYEGYDHIRQTARALAENEKGEFGFLHIVGEDYFGKRNHLETCGGGLEENEGIYEALVREIGEEMGYRVGLFGFCSRLGKFAAYAISGVVFGLAHFDIEALTAGDSARLIVEFANLPSYIGAGLFLGFIYDRFGLAASYTAHTLNNVVSLITTLAGPQA